MKFFLKSAFVITARILIVLAAIYTSQTATAETIYLYVTACNPTQSQSQKIYVTVIPTAAPGLPAGPYDYYVGNGSGSLGNATTHTFQYDGNGGWSPTSARWIQASAINVAEMIPRTVDVWYPYGDENKVYSFPFQYGGTRGSCSTNPPETFPFTYDIEGEVTIVFGATPTKSPNTKCNDVKLGGNQPDCGPCNSPPMAQPAEVGPAMAQYSVHAMQASLNIQDTPLRYTPPFGPAINFTVTYNQRESQQPATFDYSNLGPKWTFNWLSYVTEDPNTQLPSTTVYVPGGGAEIYSYDFSTQTFRPDPQSHAQLVRPNPNDHNLYEKRFPDGSKQVFSRSDGATTYPHRVFMTQVIDPVGNSVSIDYDPSSLKITKITDALGQETLFFYEHTDPLRITKVKDPFNVRFATFEYENNTIAKLKKITDVIGIQSQFEYQLGTDSINKLTTPYGATRFQYGLSGTNRWVEIIDPLGGIERVEYRDNAPGITATDPANTVPNGFTNAGFNVRNTFYWDKKATLMHPPVNGVYDYTKATIKHWLLNADESVSGILSSEKKPLEYRVWFAYLDQPDYQHAGPSANPTQVARVLGDNTTQLFQYEYDNPFHKPTKSTDPIGRETSYQYAANGIDLIAVFQGNDQIFGSTYTDTQSHLPHVITDAAGQPTTYTYTASKQWETVTNAKSETTTFAYGGTVPAGYLASITSPQHNNSSSVITFGYDDFNRVETVTDEENDTVTTEYDHLDRKTRVTYPDATYEEFQYTQDFGQGATMILDLTGSRDRLGLWTYRRYNRNRQMDLITDPLGRETSYGWCTCGSLNSITDPNGNETLFNRDLQGRVHQKVFADNTTIDYLYEGQSGPNTVGATSRLKSSTDALNRRTNYTYFRDNNVDEMRYSDTADNPLNPPTPTVNFTYDSSHNRVATTNDGTGETIYGYYEIDSPPALGAGKLRSINGPLVDDTIVFTYDELSRRVEESISTVARTMEYDTLGRLTLTTTDALGNISRTHDGVTPRLETVNSSAQTTNYTYFGNADDRRLQTLENLDSGAGKLSQFDYTYDDEGQIMSWLSLLGGTTSGRWFEYDNARQLLNSRNGQTPNAATEIYNYEYDTAGNRIGDAHFNPWGAIPNGIFHTYSPNILNQIESFITDDGMFSTVPVELFYDSAGNLTDDGEGKTFEWDAVNRLTAINYGSGMRTEFAYDGFNRRVMIVEKTGSTVTSTKHFVWIGERIAEERDANNDVTRRYYPEGEERIKTGRSKPYYYTRDHLGSIRELTDGSGNVQARYDYDPYGKRTKVSGALDVDFGYTGHYDHAPSGLNFTLYRAYNPALGRWLSRDPIGEAGGINLYGYVGNNPVNAIDPLGLIDVLIAIAPRRFTPAQLAAYNRAHPNDPLTQRDIAEHNTENANDVRRRIRDFLEQNPLDSDDIVRIVEPQSKDDLTGECKKYDQILLFAHGTDILGQAYLILIGFDRVPLNQLPANCTPFGCSPGRPRGGEDVMNDLVQTLRKVLGK